MRVVIVDDEVNAIQHLCSKLERYDAMTIQEVFSDSCKALAYLIRNPCDLLFLDINMPNISGIYIAEQIESLYPRTKICFITAYDQFAVKAFELSAIDYILKPYTDERLDICIKKLQASFVASEAFGKLSETYQYDLDMICGFDDENIILISYHDIFYMETLQGDLLIHTKHKSYIGNKSLNFYEEKLRKRSFFRTHKCYLANLAKVDRFRPRINYTYDMYFKEIKDTIPVSRNKVRELKVFFNA